jgi:hypothetical protein
MDLRNLRARPLSGLGVANEPFMPTGGSDTGGGTSTGTKVNWDSVFNIFEKAAPIVTDIYNSAKGGSSNTLPPPTQSGISTGAKIAIGTVAAGAVGTILYFAFKPKNKNK